MEGPSTPGGGRALVEGAELVYSGITGGTQHYEHGGGANNLCMPKDPEYSDTLKYEQGVSHVIVCYVSTRQSVLMIPSKASCPKVDQGVLCVPHDRAPLSQAFHV